MSELKEWNHNRTIFEFRLNDLIKFRVKQSDKDLCEKIYQFMLKEYNFKSIKHFEDFWSSNKISFHFTNKKDVKIPTKEGFNKTFILDYTFFDNKSNNPERMKEFYDSIYEFFLNYFKEEIKKEELKDKEDDAKYSAIGRTLSRFFELHDISESYLNSYTGKAIIEVKPFIEGFCLQEINHLGSHQKELLRRPCREKFNITSMVSGGRKFLEFRW